MPLFSRRHVLGLSIGALSASRLLPARAADAGTEAHGISVFGDLKYPADFHHFEYVNVAAPKGGMFSFIPSVRAYNQSFQFGFAEYDSWLNLGDAYIFLRHRQDQAADAYAQAIQPEQPLETGNRRQFRKFRLDLFGRKYWLVLHMAAERDEHQQRRCGADNGNEPIHAFRINQPDSVLLHSDCQHRSRRISAF